MSTTETTPATPAAPAPAPVAPAGEDYKAMTPEAFKARLDGERSAGMKALLKDLGFKDADEAKAFATGARQRAEAEKTELQKAQEAAKALEGVSAKAAAYEKTISSYAGQEFEALAPEHKRLVELQAGEDPHARLQVISNLRAAGILKPGAATRQPNPSTTAAPAGPTPIKPGAAANAFEQYRALQASNPGAAAHFYNLNRAAIEAARPKQQ